MKCTLGLRTRPDENGSTVTNTNPTRDWHERFVPSRRNTETGLHEGILVSADVGGKLVRTAAMAAAVALAEQ